MKGSKCFSAKKVSWAQKPVTESQEVKVLTPTNQFDQDFMSFEGLYKYLQEVNPIENVTNMVKDYSDFKRLCPNHYSPYFNILNFQINFVDLESPQSWDMAQKHARKRGSRLPTRKELQDYLKQNKYMPMLDKTMWVAVSDPKDWIEIGQNQWA